MHALQSIATALPQPRPADAAARLLLFGIRRTGAHGLHDAQAAHAFVNAFGAGFRRPLVLLRAMMAEMSNASSNPISIAPCCCPRITGAEAALLDALRSADDRPARSEMLFADLLGLRTAHGVAATARLLAGAFADAGLPLA